MNLPRHLYHYTSIEALASILKNRTIRFCALNTVDDLSEGITSDLDSIGQWFLVSCWTDNKNESIPLWNMYSSNMKGIRIKMTAFPFNNPHYKSNGEYSFFPEVMTHEGQKLDFILSFPKEKLYKVQYLRQKKEISLFEKDSNGGQNKYNFRPEEIGKYKHATWAFQKEWRYKIFLMPNELMTFHEKEFSSESEAWKELQKMFIRTKGLVWYHDMEINEDAFNNMEILTGPRCDEAEFTIIDSLLSRYNRNARVVKSKLKIRK